LKTFLSLGEIEIPFSPEIDFDITKYIFHYDSPYVKEELFNIVNDFINILITELELDSNIVKLDSINVQKIEDELYVIYIITINLIINGEYYTLKLDYQFDNET